MHKRIVGVKGYARVCIEQVRGRCKYGRGWVIRVLWHNNQFVRIRRSLPYHWRLLMRTCAARPGRNRRMTVPKVCGDRSKDEDDEGNCGNDHHSRVTAQPL